MRMCARADQLLLLQMMHTFDKASAIRQLEEEYGGNKRLFDAQIKQLNDLLQVSPNCLRSLKDFLSKY